MRRRFLWSVVGWAEHLQKTAFGWNNFSPNPLPRIHVALAQCETVLFNGCIAEYPNSGYTVQIS